MDMDVGKPGAEPDIGAAARFLLAAKQCKIRELEQLAVMSDLVKAISELVHALQKERGSSSIYLGSKGRRFSEQLAQQVADCAELEQAVREQFDLLDTPGGRLVCGARLFNRVAYAVHHLDHLPDLRARVTSQSLAPEEAVAVFTALIAGLLAVVFEAADTAADPVISRALIALFNFMQGKEFAGQERATGAAGFSVGRFDEKQHRRLLHLIEAQNRSFQIFAELADPGLVAAFKAAMDGQETVEVERMRRIACTKGLAGNLEGIESATWFTQATRRIDAMRELERQLTDALRQLSARKLGEAQADLQGHRSAMAEIESLESEAPRSIAMFVGESDRALITDAVETGVRVYSVDGLSPKLGRSILDLVQEQFRRLQSMSDELEAVRLALNERKVVDRAKGLLMTHRGLSEDQAYKMLRQMAMSQNKRLVDVAEAILSMAEILKA
ncbi:nitrate regulatory protein [Azospirillum sp. SYSU D00513]|uniref:nitrate regulatory protein n=1 Tax=Azospirillum sp. SYSU D00513 TaxID=2812561 RepID=UPI001FFE8450|nr:nitrate regulatory protein [Azospirillum sp. SYSU D00513]